MCGENGDGLDVDRDHPACLDLDIALTGRNPKIVARDALFQCRACLIGLGDK